MINAIEVTDMKKLLIFLSAIVVLAFALLLQLDIIALFHLSIAGIYDTPTPMYFLWVFPTLLNLDYSVLKDSLLIILMVSDGLIIISAVLIYLGIITDNYKTARKYHF